MSQDVRAGRSWSLFLVGWVLLPALLLVGVLVALLRTRPEGPATNGPDRITLDENLLARVRSTLAKQTDLATCRDVVGQLNTHLQRADDHKVPSLSEADRSRLRQQSGLDEAELDEVVRPTFTALDARHLADCFLFRDAARSLELAPQQTDGKAVAQTPLDRATAAFAWTVRQVRLDGRDLSPDGAPAPPADVLRRGHGTALERALVFLAVLEQFGLDEDEAVGLQGFLLSLPGKGDERRLWACGVLAGSGEAGIWLFDPRLGLPLPGADGEGIATLAAARDTAAVLARLKAGELRYDVTAEQAKTAILDVVCPLSAAAPRMLLLQNRLLRDRTWHDQALPPQVRVRLAEDPQALLERVRQAVVRSGGRREDVRLWPGGAAVLRRFLPPEEGGGDQGVRVPLRILPGFVAADDPSEGVLRRQLIFQWQAVPWEGFPAYFRDASTFRWDSPLGQEIRMIYAGPFLRSLTETGSPRDLLLRGRFSRAVPELVREQEQAVEMRRRLQQAGDLQAGLDEWTRRAVAVYADLVRARGTPEEGLARSRVAALRAWKPDEPIALLLGGSVAGPRGAWLAYQLALCRHEQAERHEQRLALARRAGVALPGEAQQARKTWTDAEDYWREYLETYPGRPGVAAARRLRGEALVRLGRGDEAAAVWKDVSAPMTDLEKLASLWLAATVPAK